MTTTTEDKFEHARSNAKGWYESIKTLISQLNDPEMRDAAETEIQEGPLEVAVRDGWRSPGGTVGPNPEPAEEFKILLTTGGPALRIWGTLDEHGQPKDCELQMQDWGTPWAKWVPEPYDEEYRDTLLAYASCFYFGD